MSRVVALVMVCVGIVLVAPLVGPALADDTAAFVLWQLRVPRVLVGAVVGATLGVVGASFQAIFGNPLAAPSTTGTTAGAALGALAALVLLPGSWTAATPVVAAAALVGALAVSLPVAALAARGSARIEDVLLAGVALTLGAGALTTGLQLQADMASTFRAVRWSLGSLSQVGYGGVVVLTPLAAVAIAVVLAQTRALAALVGGEARAFSQGVDVVRVRTTVLVAGSLGVAACVAWCGPIAFVGLVVPHLVRLSLGPARRVLLPTSAVAGAAFVVAADAFGRVVLPGREIPVGVLSAAVGAPLLVWLVLSRGRR